jgi:hypothetical protein
MDGRLTHATRSSVVCAIAAAALALVVPAGARAAVAPTITSGPTISRTPQVGSTLTASATWSGDPEPVATWRWLRCTKTPDNCSVIVGATTDAYRPTSEDIGAMLRVRLTVRNSSGSDQARSDPTAVVTPAPTPAPTATPTPTATPAPTATPTPTATATPSPTATPAVGFDVAPALPSPTQSPSPVRSGRTELRLLEPFPLIRIKGRLTARGARVTLLSIRAPRGVRIIVSCRGRDCPVRRFAARRAVHRLRAFERELRAGTRLEITVIKAGFIGKRTVFVVRRGAAPSRSDRCVNSGTQRDMRCPPG